LSRSKVQEYYRVSRDTEIRTELEFALKHTGEGKVAVDCGCGAGANIAHLRKKGFVVHAYDIDEEALSMCTNRFIDDRNVFISSASFGTFEYPKSSLVLADASLFFCPAQELITFVEKAKRSLQPKGVFCGAFLGRQDTMAQPENESQVYWGEPLVKSESEIRGVLSGFEILQMSEIISDGIAPNGDKHHWHIHVVVARVISGL